MELGLNGGSVTHLKILVWADVVGRVHGTLSQRDANKLGYVKLLKYAALYTGLIDIVD